MWTIIKKDTLENILTLRFIIGFLACNIVFGIVTYVLVQDFNLEWNSVQAAKYESEQTIAGWEVYSFVRPTVFKEPSLLAVFGSNMGKSWGKRIWISHTRIPVFTYDETAGGTLADFLGFFYSFDFPSVTQIFISLLALLFSFNAVNGEKERATLKLILSNHLQRTTLFVGKFIGALLALLPIIISSLLVAFFIYLMNTPAPLTADDWLGMALILLTTILLGAVFIAIGMLISVLTHRTASSLIICMIVWVFLILVVPNAVGFLSSEFGFSEDSREFERRLSALYSEFSDGIRAIRYTAADYMVTANTFGSTDGGILFRIVSKNAEKFYMERLPIAIRAQNEYGIRRFDIENAYYEKRMNKMNLAGNLMRISPSSIYANIANALARTDAASHHYFIERARSYREELMDYIDSKGGYTSRRWFTNDTEDAPYRELMDEQADQMTLLEMGQAFQDPQLITTFMSWIDEVTNDPARKLDLSDMPRFESRQLPLLQAVNAALFDVFLIVVFLAIVVAITYIRFLSYDAR